MRKLRGNPVDQVAAEPIYLDVEVPPDRRKTLPVETTPNAFAYVLFGRGDEVTVEAAEEGIRFLLISGKPLGEPVAWYGPIVMNTQAFEELQRGTFLKTGARR